MIVVLRAYGLRIVIFRDDHEPAQVHIRGDGHGKVVLIGKDGQPEFIWSSGMTKADRRRALIAIRESQEELLQQWRNIHGGTD